MKPEMQRRRIRFFIKNLISTKLVLLDVVKMIKDDNLVMLKALKKIV
jgi:hypothetical protein